MFEQFAGINAPYHTGITYINVCVWHIADTHYTIIVYSIIYNFLITKMAASNPKIREADEQVAEAKKW